MKIGDKVRTTRPVPGVSTSYIPVGSEGLIVSEAYQDGGPGFMVELYDVGLLKKVKYFLEATSLAVIEEVVK